MGINFDPDARRIFDHPIGRPAVVVGGSLFGLVVLGVLTFLGIRLERKQKFSGISTLIIAAFLGITTLVLVGVVAVKWFNQPVTKEIEHTTEP